MSAAAMAWMPKESNRILSFRSSVTPVRHGKREFLRPAAPAELQAHRLPAVATPSLLFDFARLAIHPPAPSRAVKTRLLVGPPGDEYEREADRVADLVTRTNDPPDDHNGITETVDDQSLGRTDRTTLRRQPAPVEEAYREPPEPIGLSSAVIEEEEEEAVARTSRPAGEAGEVPSALDSSLNPSRTPGVSLPEPVRTFMEGRFGVDFSDVLVHHNDEAARLSSLLEARAFTIGNHVYFGSNQYRPESTSGRRLLAHELTHVVQGREGSASRPRNVPGTHTAPRGAVVVRRLATTFTNFRRGCDCGEDLGNNCAHYLSDALIRSGYAELDGGQGGLYRRRNNRVVCRSGRPVRAAELAGWFAGRATATNAGEPTDDTRHWAVYQERRADGQGHVVIHHQSGQGQDYDWRGTGDYPTWQTQDHYTW